MKSIMFSAFSLMLLILFMVGFNRLNKSSSKEKKPFSIMGVTAYNSGDAIPENVPGIATSTPITVMQITSGF